MTRQTSFPHARGRLAGTALATSLLAAIGLPLAVGSAAVAADEPEDTTPPAFTAATPLDGGSYAIGEPFVVDFGCSDPESGIALCDLYDPQWAEERAIGEIVELPEGDYTWIGTAVSGSGAVTTTDVHFSVAFLGEDVTPPTLTHDWTTPAGEWTSDSTVNFSAQDAESGVAEIRINNGAITRVVPTADAGYDLPEGESRLTAWAIDRFGNASEPSTTTFAVDRSAPLVAIGAIGRTAPDGARLLDLDEDALFTFTATDAISGVDGLSSSYFPGARIDTSSAGEQTVTVSATDRAGNTTTARAVIRVIDPSVPVDPVDPVDPTDPVDPADPVDPVDAAPSLPATPARTQGGTLATTGGDEAGALGATAVALGAAGLVLMLIAARSGRHARPRRSTSGTR